MAAEARKVYIGRTMRALLSVLFLLLSLSQAPARAEQITLVAENDWYPYTAQRDGRITGLTVDLVRAAYASVGVSLQLKSMPFARCMTLVERGDELGCFNSGQDLKHSQDSYLFHATPLLLNSNGIYARVDNKESGLGPAALSGRRVVLTHGGSYGDTIEANQSIVRVVALSDLANLRMLAAGRADFTVLDDRVFDYLVQANAGELRGKLKRVGRAFNDLPIYVAFSRKRAEAPRHAALLDQGLAALKASGEYRRIVERWQLPP
ncbi:substrate-binding periplasmic protein [Paucibacter sp. JuS9]|uniref:substrate-binding periplasmic protein n=1 Tax=Paucibacter sp. JuS9 TaxID=3228748 RepID=UPI003757EA87